MDQQHVTLQRLRREVTYQVTDMHKSQRRRLNRLRDDLRFAPLPSAHINRIVSDTAVIWAQSFSQLEQQLSEQTAHLLANGIDYHTLRTELTRQATTTLHNLLDLPITPNGMALCSPSDRMLRLTTRAWTAIMLIGIIVAATLAGFNVITPSLAVVVGGATVLARAALEALCLWRTRANRDQLTVLDTHLHTVTAQVQDELNRLPDAITHAVEP